MFDRVNTNRKLIVPREKITLFRCVIEILRCSIKKKERRRKKRNKPNRHNKARQSSIHLASLFIVYRRLLCIRQDLCVCVFVCVEKVASADDIRLPPRLYLPRHYHWLVSIRPGSCCCYCCCHRL